MNACQTTRTGDDDVNHTQHSIGSSLMTHGIQGIDTHYKTGQLMADARNRQLIIDLRDAGAADSLRHRLGRMMISLGAAIAGKTHDIQERQATRPSHPSAKAGAVPSH